jgi:hypothetical protein
LSGDSRGAPVAGLLKQVQLRHHLDTETGLVDVKDGYDAFAGIGRGTSLPGAVRSAAREFERNVSMAAIPHLTLNNGVEIPAIGFGVFQTPPDETRDAVGAALSAGYRHIDTA